jgi:hypothetical protein
LVAIQIANTVSGSDRNRNEYDAELMRTAFEKH